MRIINNFLFANCLYDDGNTIRPCVINMDYVKSITVRYSKIYQREFICVNLGNGEEISICPEGDINDVFIYIADYYTICQE